jgi:hypothetical protein
MTAKLDGLESADLIKRTVHGEELRIFAKEE